MKETEEIKKLSLVEKMNLVAEAVGVVQKKLTVSLNPKQSYKAVGESDVIQHVNAAESMYRVNSRVYDVELLKSDTYTRSTGSVQYLDDIKVTVRITDIDHPSDFVDCFGYGRGIDYGDKGFGKATTYGRKYALMGAYKIATGEDLDAKGSVEEKVRRRAAAVEEEERVRAAAVEEEERVRAAAQSLADNFEAKKAGIELGLANCENKGDLTMYYQTFPEFAALPAFRSMFALRGGELENV